MSILSTIAGFLGNRRHSVRQFPKIQHRVIDGDTIKIGDTSIRLYGIDAPEKNQDFGPMSTGILAHLVSGGFSVEIVSSDKYGRQVGIFHNSDGCANAQMIALGAAWHYADYCKLPFCGQWADLQRRAMAIRIGLWKHPRPIPPWDFRKG